MVQKKHLSQQNIKNNRGAIIKSALSVSRIKANDGRIKDSTRRCGVCHRELTFYSVELGEAVVSTPHLSCKLSDIATVNLCLDIRSCYSNIGLEGD